MASTSPRGIAVVDVGATNSKVILFDFDLRAIEQRRTETVHREGPPYRHVDPERIVDFAVGALSELDKILPVDAIVVSGFGSTMGCVDEAGRPGNADYRLHGGAAGGDRRGLRENRAAIF